MRLISSLLLICLLISTAYGDDAKGVWVEGVGQSEAKPDIVSFNFSVSTLDKSAKKSQQNNAQIADKVLTKLKSAGVAGKDIQTVSFNISQEYDYQNRIRVLRGHRVLHSYVAILRDVAKVGSTLDALTSVGDDSLSISSISFGLSQAEDFKLKALAQAVEHARSKAQVLAKAGDKKLGKVRAIEELTSIHHAPVLQMEMMKARSADTTTPVESGEVAVSARVKVHFELE